MDQLQTQKNLFDNVSLACSRLTTKSYSTSFSWGIKCLDRSLQDGIYSIYGFVRFADEIVDTFHGFEQKVLFDRFEEDTYNAIRDRISLNPILNSFQHAVNRYNIQLSLIDKFLASMRMDLTMKEHNEETYKEYILGSAEVVGLMCLHVFCKGDMQLFESLKEKAMKLGSAFQKINFLRDANADFNGLGRTYFPQVDLKNFNDLTKEEILKDIAHDFHEGYLGIKQLPREARFGVYVAYIYYIALFNKIKNTPPCQMMKARIRVKNFSKLKLFILSFFRHQLNLI